MFTVFEHTADLGLRIEAPTLEQLFVDAARGLFSLLVANLDTVRPVVEKRVDVAGTERDYLLFDWLAELLYLSETEKLVFSQVELTIDDQGVHAIVRGEPIDESHHLLEHEVKAITYHQLKVEQGDDGWVAEVIVDI